MNDSPRKTSPATTVELRTALDAYRKEVAATRMTDSTKKTYLLHAENFVRWIEGDFTPGARLG